ncbi:cellular macromolecule catabolic process, partial [Fusarium falciforme]
MINPIILGAGEDLSKLTPAQLYALGTGLAAGANAPAAGMKKTKGGQKPQAKTKAKAK